MEWKLAPPRNLRKKLEGMEALGKLKLHLAARALQIRSPTLRRYLVSQTPPHGAVGRIVLVV